LIGLGDREGSELMIGPDDEDEDGTRMGVCVLVGEGFLEDGAGVLEGSADSDGVLVEVAEGDGGIGELDADAGFEGFAD